MHSIDIFQKFTMNLLMKNSTPSHVHDPALQVSHCLSQTAAYNLHLHTHRSGAAYWSQVVVPD